MDIRLSKSELRNRILFNNIPSMVYRADTDWSLEIISGCELISGYTATELAARNKSWIDIIWPEDLERVLKGGQEVVQSSKPAVQIYRIVTKQGQVRWVEDRKASLMSEEGEFIAIEGIVFDITERKRMELSLRKAHEKLEQRVKERTFQLERQKIRLEEANVALNVLLEKRTNDKRKLEEQILANIKKLTLPYIEELKKYRLNGNQKVLVDAIAHSIQEIVSSFSVKLSCEFLGLTRTETLVADLIRQGRSTKEIAVIRNLSPKTVERHREHIRAKLDIKNKGINLCSYLRSLP